MKDSKGHGSNKGAGTSIPPNPHGGMRSAMAYRAAHQLATDKVGRQPEWQAAIASQARAFAKNESGEGRLPSHLDTLHLATAGMHLVHFLHVMGALILMDAIVHYVMGWPLT